jgi:hypothetical protein
MSKSKAKQYSGGTEQEMAPINSAPTGLDPRAKPKPGGVSKRKSSAADFDAYANTDNTNFMRKSSNMGERRISTNVGYAEIEQNQPSTKTKSPAIQGAAYGAVQQDVPETTYPDLEGNRHPLGEPGDGGTGLLSTDFTQGLTHVEVAKWMPALYLHLLFMCAITGRKAYTEVRVQRAACRREKHLAAPAQ